jgi:hypothetical protein
MTVRQTRAVSRSRFRRVADWAYLMKHALGDFKCHFRCVTQEVQAPTRARTTTVIVYAAFRAVQQTRTICKSSARTPIRTTPDNSAAIASP